MPTPAQHEQHGEQPVVLRTNGRTVTVAVMTADPMSSDRRRGRSDVDGSEDEAGEHAAAGVAGQQGAGESPVPVLVGEGDRTELDGSEHARRRRPSRPSAAGDRRCAAPTGGPAPCADGGGSLARCADQRPPCRRRTTSAAASRPACGATRVASTVTSSGPEHEDELVEHRLEGVRRAEPRVGAEHVPPAGPHQRPDRRREQRRDHHRRPLAPGPGRRGSPAARRCSARRSARARTAAAPGAGRSRSTRRAMTGAAPALTRAKAADSAPARPYRPVSATTSSTMPSPTIAIGSRARNAAEEKRRPARGPEEVAVRATARAARYGTRARRPRGPEPLARITVSPERSPTARRTTPSCWCPSAVPRDRTTCCRSWRTSPAAGASRASGCWRWASTTSAFGGVSPINAQNRALVAALEAEFAAHGLDLPVYWGNRNWAPYLTDELARIADDGRHRVLALLTSAYSSYSGCRQYRENLADAVAPLGDRAPARRPDPALLQPSRLRRGDGARHGRGRRRAAGRCSRRCAAGLRHALGPDADGRDQRPGRPRVQHPAPRRRPAGHRRGGGRDRGRPRAATSSTAAGAGRPAQPWLEPDVNDHLEALAGRRRPGGRAGADRLRLGPHGGQVRPRHRGAGDGAHGSACRCARAATVGTDPRFVAAVRELVLERAAVVRGEQPAAAGRSASSGRATTCARRAAAPTRATPTGPRCAGRDGMTAHEPTPGSCWRWPSGWPGRPAG